MRRIKDLIVSLICITAFVACQNEDELVQFPIQDGNTVLSVEDKDILCTGGSFSVAFTSNSPWQLKGCPEWLEVNKTYGRSGTTTITLSADCNDTRADRVANLIFEAQDGSFSTPMIVSQTYPYLNVDVDTLSFNWNDCRTEREGVIIDNNPQIIKISSNVAWRITEIHRNKANIVDFTHFSLSSERGEKDDSLEIIPIRDNFNKVPYDVQLLLTPVVRDEEGNEIEISSKATNSYVLKLHQKNLKFLINDSADDAELEFNELNDNPNINLNIDSEIEWTVAECPSWIVMNKDKGKDLVTVNIQTDGPNPTCEKREGVIKLSTDAGAYREINVSQLPYVFEIEATDINIGNDDINEYKFNLTTTGTWEIKDIPLWLTVTPSKCEETTPTSGKQVHEISVSAKGQNLDFYDYSQLLRVCSSMNSLSDTVQVKQNKFIFNVEYSTTLTDLPTMNIQKYPVSIESTGRWEIIDAPDWIDISESSNEKGIYSITVGAKDGNPDITKDRSATLSVVSVNHLDANLEVVRYINVKQRKYIFEVTPLDEVVVPAYKNVFEPFFATICCSADWTLSQYPSWITPSVTSGDGTADVTVVFNPTVNVAKTERHGLVTIKSLYNNEEKTIVVTQDAFVFDNENQSFNVAVMNTESFPVSFNLTEEAEWTILSGYSPWLKPSSTTGTGRGAVLFTPDPNPELSERTGTATIQSTISGENKVITFVQEKYEFDSTPESFSYSELDKANNTVSITSSGPWSIENAPSWMNISSKNGNSSTIITINPSNNTSLTERNASFNIVSKLNNLTKSITVRQDAFKFDNTPETYSYTTLEERTDEFQVLSSGKWKAKDVPEWVSLSKTIGNGSESGITESVSVVSTRNLTESDREATIQIVSNDNSSHVKKVHLHQDKFDFRIDNSAFVYTNPLDLTSRILGVICPATWTIENDESWVSVSVEGGEGDGNVIITPQPNLTTLDRSAIITVSSTLNSLKRMFTVSQSKFIFNVDKSSYVFNSPIGLENSALSVNVECSADWTVSKDSEWINLSSSSGSGNSSFIITPTTNPNTSERKGKVVVTSTMNGITKEITISQKAFEFDSTEANISFVGCAAPSQNIDIICSGAWTITNTGDSWLSVSQSVTSGNGHVVLTANDNSSESSRSAIVTITATDNPSLTKKINITQERHDITLSKSNIALSANPSRTEDFTITTTGPWEITSNQTWCKVSSANGAGNATISVNADINASTADRTATITVICPNTLLKRTINVSQSKFIFNVDKNSHMFNSPIGSENNALNVNVECSADWTVSKDSEWINISTTNGFGNSSFTITPKTNSNTSERKGKVTITSSVNGLTKEILISQKAFEFDSTEANISFVGCAAPSQYVNVTCSGVWTITNTGTSWLSASQSVTNGNGHVVLTANNNTSESPRNAIVTITATDNPALTKKINITQERHDITLSKSSIVFSPIPSSPESFTITTIGPWTITSDQTWCTVSSASGTGNATITVNADLNTNTSNRTATITITCPNTSLKRTISVSQEKFVFSLSSSSREIDANSTEPITTTVSCSTQWSATSDSEWLTVSTSGSILIMTPTENHGAERTAIVTIENLLSSTKLVYIVKQLGIKIEE